MTDLGTGDVRARVIEGRASVQEAERFVTALEAECDRYREALERIGDNRWLADNITGNRYGDRQLLLAARQIAQRALEGKS